VQLIEDHESSIEDNPTRIKFRISVNNDKAEEIITYNKMLEYITKDEESDIMWKFRQIISHKVQGSQINLLVKWENGEITKEALKIISADDPVTCALYGRENGLPDKPGWKCFKHIAKNKKKFTHMVNQPKLKSFNTAPKYKYGYKNPRTYEQAKHLDEKNWNTLWGDATALELNQIDKGHHTKATPPELEYT
jgi:hypothetical protein